VIAALLPVIFILGLEGVLRLVGYGDAYPLFKPFPGYESYRYPNDEVARRYFGKQRAVPSIPFDSFRAKKLPNGVRVFVQGGSTAAGFPFYFGGSFGDILEQRLLQSFPGRPIEVVSTAMAAVNSYALLDLADEIIEEDPDVILIYAGHNEYYGALGVASAESVGRGRAVVLLYQRLSRFRLVQAVRALLFRTIGLLRGGGQAVPGATLMERMVGERAIPYGSPMYGAGIDQFRANLSALLEKYRDRDIPVLIGTLVSNERNHRPFISSVGPDVDVDVWQQAYSRALRYAQAGAIDHATAVLDSLIRADSVAADPYFARAVIKDRQGDHAAARLDFLAAKDRDQLRFRAPEAMNRVIREEAERHGAVVVESQAAFVTASPGGIPGDNLMTEHLHPTAEGQFILADAFYDALRDSNLLGRWVNTVSDRDARREMLFTPVDSLVGEIRLKKLKGSWPFQPPGVVDRSVDTMSARNPVEAIALDLYRGQITRVEALRKQGDLFLRMGDSHRALQSALALIQRYPFVPEGYLYAADILRQQRRYDEALEYYLASNERKESAVAQRMIGSLLLQKGNRQEAIGFLQSSLEREPENAQALYNLAGAFALQGNYARSRETIGTLLQIEPGHVAARQLLESLPE
jgi:tetratricopeptide (TPR) repeat protein